MGEQETNGEETEAQKTVPETISQLGKLSDEELVALQESDDRKTVQAAVEKELDRRTAGEAAAEAPKIGLSEGDSYDLIGEDGRRILRWHSEEACKELQGRLDATTGETTTIKSSY